MTSKCWQCGSRKGNEEESKRNSRGDRRSPQTCPQGMTLRSRPTPFPAAGGWREHFSVGNRPNRQEETRVGEKEVRAAVCAWRRVYFSGRLQASVARRCDERLARCVLRRGRQQGAGAAASARPDQPRRPKSRRPYCERPLATICVESAVGDVVELSRRCCGEQTGETQPSKRFLHEHDQRVFRVVCAGPCRT